MVPGLRGSILDRNGTRLASSEDAATIYATPYQVKNPPQAAARLAPILKQKKGKVLEELTVESGFSYLAKDIDLADRGEGRKARNRRDRPAARPAAAPTRRAKWRAR